MDVPNEEWDILYRLRLQAERDLLRRALGGTAVIDPLTIDATQRTTGAEAVDDAEPRRGPRRRPGPRAVTANADPRSGTVRTPTSEPARRRCSGPSSRSWASSSFVALTVALASGVVFPFDRPLLDFAKAWAGPKIIWNVVSQSANFPLIFLGVGFVLWLIWQHRYREAVLAIAVLVAVTAGSEGVKQLTARQRPAGNGDGIPGVVYSYPSGHILECFTILGMIALRYLAHDATPAARRPDRRASSSWRSSSSASRASRSRSTFRRTSSAASSAGSRR